MSGFLLKIWSYFSIQVRIALIILAICGCLFAYLYQQKRTEQAEIEQRLKIWTEAQAEKDAQKVREQKENANKAANLANQIRIQSFANMTDKQLRDELIRESDRQKKNK